MFAAEMPSWHSILMAAFQTECVGVHAGCSDTLLGAYVGHDGFIVLGILIPQYTRSDAGRLGDQVSAVGPCPRLVGDLPSP